jgi:triosephosphate isomerase
LRTGHVVGNWKLNGSLSANEALLKAVREAVPKAAGCRFGVCVPYPYLAQARDLLAGSGVEWGAQDCSRFDKGAYTGDVSGGMLAEFGCTYGIVGHSERRTVFGDTDAVVAEKFAAARRAKLTAILCVGETLEERERGVTDEVLARQLDAVLDKQGAAALDGALLAYEPVWAIGTGKVAQPQQVEEAHGFLRAILSAATAPGIAADARILYGGSVNPGNAAGLARLSEVDGFLVGGASLDPSGFRKIVEAAAGG